MLKNSKSNSKKKGNTAEGFEHQENTSKQDTEAEEKHDNDKSAHSGNYFDGLEMDFWEEEVETATKPDYRRRWKDLNNSYEDEANNDDTNSEIFTEEAIGSRKYLEEEDESSQEKQTKNSVSSTIGWGEKMWQEIDDDWSNEDGEKWKKYKVRKRKKEKPDDSSSTDENGGDDESIPIQDDGARYLSAWADAGEILEPKHFNDNRYIHIVFKLPINFYPNFSKCWV